MSRKPNASVAFHVDSGKVFKEDVDTGDGFFDAVFL